MKTYIIIFSIAVISFLGCEKEDIQTPPRSVDDNNNGFEKFEVAEIFANNCAVSGCHAGTNPEHNLSFESHSKMLSGSLFRPLDDSIHHHSLIPKFSHTDGSIYGGEAVIPYNSGKSLLYNLITGNVENPEHKMPYQRQPLTDEQINIVKTWIDNGAKDNFGNVPFSNYDNKTYAASQGDDRIYVIDNEYKLVTRIIDLNYNTSGLDQPHNIQVAGNFIYASLISTGRFVKIDRISNQVTGYVENLEVPGMITFSPDKQKVFVSKSSTAPGTYNTIYVIDPGSMTRLDDITLPVAGLPHAIAVSKNNKLYVANMSRDRISVCNLITGEFEDDIVLSSGPAVVHEPMHIYISPDDMYLYVNARTSSKMLIIDLASKTIIQELAIKHHPMQAAISKDGNKIYVVSHHEPVITEITKQGTVWTITNEYQDAVFHHLYGCDLTEDGKYLVVSCSNNDPSLFFEPHYKIPGIDRTSLICFYDTEIKKLVKIIDIGKNATGVAIRNTM